MPKSDNEVSRSNTVKFVASYIEK